MPQGMYFTLFIAYVVVTGFCRGTALPVARRISHLYSGFAIDT